MLDSLHTIPQLFNTVNIHISLEIILFKKNIRLNILNNPLFFNIVAVIYLSYLR